MKKPVKPTEKKCKNCQNLKPHGLIMVDDVSDPHCILCKRPIFPHEGIKSAPPSDTEEWEDEFKEMSYDPIRCYTWKEIKSFIKTLLARQRRELIEEIFNKVTMLEKVHSPKDDAVAEHFIDYYNDGLLRVKRILRRL